MSVELDREEARLRKELQGVYRPKPKPWKEIVVTFLASIFAIALLSLLFAFPAKWINWLFAPNAIKYIFGMPVLPVWQAWGLMFLFGLLFGRGATK